MVCAPAVAGGVVPPVTASAEPNCNGQGANGLLRFWANATDPDSEEMSVSPFHRADWRGGDGMIIAPDRTCRTAGLDPTGTSATLRADGYVSSGAIIAAGATARTR